MSRNEALYSLGQFEKALQRLREAITQAQDGDPLKQDGAIQRFEFTFELMWKTLKVYFEYLGKRIANPRDTFKEAFRQQLFSDEKVFLDMLDDRNTSTHAYDFETTRKIFGHIQTSYLVAMELLVKEIQRKL
ncbi:MAG: nucleotidyltransferase substrate binding protein [Deltaproteobacteria bacterium]|nr:nucleotidyltransferase substrate binding protein [Deltaproteobacteria bacterium]